MTGGMMLNGILTVQSFQVANLLAPPANQGQKEETALLLQMTTIRIGQKWKAEGHPPEQAAGDVIATTKIDGWGRPIQYETDGESFSLISFGADGISSTDDVRLGPFTSAEAAYEAYGIDLSK